MSTIPNRLAALREQMREHHLDAYLISDSDPHCSEYLSEHWQGRRWISGFTGTAGSVVITQNQAGLWTDGRYYIQAEEQLSGSGIVLFRAADPNVPDWNLWLQQVLPVGSRVGFDGDTVSIDQAQALLDYGLEIAPEYDLLNIVWQDRPAPPLGSVFEHSEEFAGLTVADKLAELRQSMLQHKTDFQLVNSLDDIAWLFNIRGIDLPYCPLVLSHALVGSEQCWLFIEPDKMPDSLSDKLRQQGVTLQDYQSCAAKLAQLPSSATLRLDSAVTNITLYQQLPASIKVQRGQQLTTALKAIKNSTEQKHFHQCMRDDGVAMVRFMRWLEEKVPTGKVTELSAEAKLESLRQQITGYQQPSFRTIAGYLAHGAKMHYAATSESNVTIEQHGFFLVDSGGQFPNGTTDITRTFNFGSLTDKEREDYTLVLKAFISLSKARFKQGCRGTQIDALARAPLWERGIDYSCGTGHGVGFFLNVHEGPHSLSQKWIDEPLQPGMTVTIEPGIYREGEYGIRIENILLVVEDITTEFGTFYRFEPLTLAPINTLPVVRSLLSDNEILWLNRYHQHVYDSLSPILETDEREWLKRQTAAL